MVEGCIKKVGVKSIIEGVFRIALARIKMGTRTPDLKPCTFEGKKKTKKKTVYWNLIRIWIQEPHGSVPNPSSLIANGIKEGGGVVWNFMATITNTWFRVKLCSFLRRGYSSSSSSSSRCSLHPPDVPLLAEAARISLTPKEV